ncbi:SUMF1/EgtB/PvdO family nonheme iron enzyme [Noviherbaspirillum galbum]|uniref:SUMF1/EgtB/PvdO family nonheme iron enzyme n=1 Tax=Noviherbaspirillum galbum TaxID=2709383 RepID=A0A6B3SPG5_9BURK|nr:SUMF1/EgtB/PvdO family nonheme iron enzyme [Noviherbaspirillum galbum]NEX62790.1 SUMF1/EgtB/PvdO family nonheme iron enzyme [Noviherbaspirillum galbum]
MRKRLFTLLRHASAALLFCLCGMQAALASVPVALVIGNADDRFRPIPQARHDARDMAAALEALGYDVLRAEDLDRQGMHAAIQVFFTRLGAGADGLVYFAGHAAMRGGDIMLSPVGAQPEVSVSALLAKMEGHRRIVVLDTCLTPADGDTALAIPLPADTLLALAAQPGHGAGDAGRNGIFTARLLAELRAPGRPVGELLASTAAAVTALTQGRQRPWAASTLPASMSLLPDGSRMALRTGAEAASGPETVLAYDTRGVLPKDTNEQYELTFWDSIKDSNHADDYEAYLQAYPKGRFAALAKARIERLRAEGKGAKEASKPAAETPKPAPKAAETPKPAPKAAETPRAAPPAAPPVQATPSAPAAEQPAPRRNASAEIKDCPTCPDLISLPAGSFTMGSNTGDPTEKPEHRVTLASGFAIGKYEVTLEQWNACVDTGGCTKVNIDASKKNVPVRDVSWDDAQQYVKWLTKITGKSYRLPTEAEWEYAARGGTSTRFWWGEQMRKGTANCKDCGPPWQQDAPAPVGSFAPNPFGLHDVNGSVWEWVSDCWHTSFKGAPADGKSWEDPACRVRVIRGGSWREDASYMPSSTRFKYDANVRHTQNGFRVVRELK